VKHDAILLVKQQLCGPRNEKSPEAAVGCRGFKIALNLSYTRAILLNGFNESILNPRLQVLDVCAVEVMSAG